MTELSCCRPGGSDASRLMEMVLWYVLDAFPRLGRAPQLEELSRDLFLSSDEVTRILDSLEAEGALRVEPTTKMILDAYPYVPCTRTVQGKPCTYVAQGLPHLLSTVA